MALRSAGMAGPTAAGAAASSASSAGPAHSAAESPSAGCSGRARPEATADRLVAVPALPKSDSPPARSRHL